MTTQNNLNFFSDDFTVLSLIGNVIFSDDTSDGDQFTTETSSFVADEFSRSRGQTHAERFAGVLNSGIETDITLLAGSDKTPFRAHKSILTIASSFFEEAFRKNTNSKAFHFPELEVHDVDLFLKFLYTGTLPSKVTSAIPLLSMSKLCSLPDLARQCEKLLNTHLGVDSVFQLYEQAVTFGIKYIANNTMEFICRNAKQLIESPEFISLKASTLSAILVRDSLEVHSEIQIFDAVMRWANHQLELQGTPVTGEYIRSTVKEFISLIRFPLISPEDFTMKVATTEILTSDELVVILLYFNVPANQRSVINPGLFITRPRYYTSTRKEVLKRALFTDGADQSACEVETSSASSAADAVQISASEEHCAEGENQEPVGAQPADTCLVVSNEEFYQLSSEVRRFQQIVNKKLNDLADSIKTISQIVGGKFSVRYTEAKKALEKFSFPLKTVEDLEIFSNYIKGSDETRTTVLTVFGAVGGKSVKEGVDRLMKRLMTNELILQFTLTGKKSRGCKNKRALKDTGITLLIFECLKTNTPSENCTEWEVEKFIAAHLNAKDKVEGREKRRQKMLQNDEEATTTKN